MRVRVIYRYAVGGGSGEHSRAAYAVNLVAAWAVEVGAHHVVHLEIGERCGGVYRPGIGGGAVVTRVDQVAARGVRATTTHDIEPVEAVGEPYAVRAHVDGGHGRPR